MVNYLQSKIYKIVGNNLTYYGSTCEPTLAKRLTKHRSHFKSYKAGKYHYVTSFKVFETGIFDIILVEKFPCTCKDELYARERYYIENYDCVNHNLPGQSKKMYYEANREEFKTRSKLYNEKNREKILTNKKLYNELHRDKIKKYNKLYHELHREKIKIYQNKKLNCICGGEYTISHKNRHLESKKHQRYTMLISFNKLVIAIDNIMNMINNISM